MIAEYYVAKIEESSKQFVSTLPEEDVVELNIAVIASVLAGTLHEEDELILSFDIHLKFLQLSSNLQLEKKLIVCRSASLVCLLDLNPNVGRPWTK